MKIKEKIMGIKLGLVGLGMFGSQFAKLFKAHPLVDKIALCDCEAEKVKTFLEDPFMADKVSAKDCYQHLDDICKADLDAIVVIGGDGSFRGARDLSLHGIPCVGIPATIDNDISSTDYTIGFDTAMNTVVELVDKLRDTACSHDRCSVVEVMGHGAGDLALQCGLAVGATSVIVPEKTYDPEAVITKIRETQKRGRNHFIIVVSEGLCDVRELAKQVEESTGIESRATILGHIQRGGSPTLRDRVVASKMGYAAVELLKNGIGNRVIALKNCEIVNYDIFEALNMPKTFDEETYLLANMISS